MKKFLTLLVFTCLIGVSCYSQDVVFEKFELKWYGIMGIRSDSGQSLNITLKNTSFKAIKYVTVHYNVMNEVGDFVADDINRTDFAVNCTGPFYAGKKTKLYAKLVVFFPRLLKAVPSRIDIVFMNGDEEEIDITEENMKLYFPKIKL